MGFKRTSEGRVFFQGSDGTANDQPGQPGRLSNGQTAQKPQNSGRPATGHMHNQQTQTQIVTLLKTLNERLKLTQAERNKMRHELDAYREVIEDLENKAERSEKAYLDLEQRIAQSGQNDSDISDALAKDALKEMEETRRLLLNLESQVARHQKVGDQILKKQGILETTQQKHAQKMLEHGSTAAQLTKRVKESEARQEDLTSKIENTSGEQAKLGRKLDKAIEERARFMRKIERIEETVLQTRDSLNAKAMVLLTDQNVAQESGDFDPAIDEHLFAAEARQGPSQQKQKSEWKLPYNLKTTGVAALVVVGVLGGWAISEVQKPNLPQISFVGQNAPETTVSVDRAIETLPGTTTSEAIASMDWSINSDTSDFAAQTTQPAAQAQAFDDIGTLSLNDQEQVQALLDNNPQALASALNDIEPGNPQAAEAEETVTASLTEQTTAAPVETAPAPAPTPEAPAPDTASSLKPSDKVQDPATLIKPDSALKDVIKDIEAQAFKGVAEAQHDLAAIYTAGHGGVTQNYERARFWFEQAAARGISNAAYNLGVLHHQGLGASADLEKALGWYGEAAKLGHPEAAYNLGIAYIEGIGVPYNAQKATAYFTDAANSNIMEAAYNLGLIHENGLLGAAKPDEALMWYKIASDQGSPEAKQALEQLAKTLNMDPADINRLAESMKALKKAPASTAAPAATARPTPVAQEPQASNGYADQALGEQVLTAQIQEYLMNSGLYPGPADGITGPLTADAVRSYQSQNGLNPDGKITQDLLTHMLSNQSL